MSDQPLSQASAACEESGQSSDRCQDTEENFLGSVTGWKSEAEAVIKDVQNFVKNIAIAEKIESGSSHIYLNVTTLENQELTVELSANGFRIVSSRCHNQIDNLSSDELSVFETPYSLLESVSPAYIEEFGKALAQKLASLQSD